MEWFEIIFLDFLLIIVAVYIELGNIRVIQTYLIYREEFKKRTNFDILIYY